MSHQPHRKEKDCLNCGTTVYSRFCHAYGQENTVPHQSFGHLVKHFLYDFFHFDGKFFETLPKLLFHPGTVPSDYICGNRARHLDPIRMYLFTYAFFFLVFFAFGERAPAFWIKFEHQLTREDRQEMLQELLQQPMAAPGDTSVLRMLLLILFFLLTIFQL